MEKIIKEKLSLLPDKPGCYLMKNKDEIIIYVGKAKKLKRRVNSYFNRTHTGKTAKLVNEIKDFEYVVVGSETESLILEINLIKKYDPKYNILLRDDKSYPYIELTNEEVPRLVVIRNINLKKTNRHRLYGPYPNVTAARSTVNLLNRLYPLRKCKTYPDRPCLYYHIGQCLGFCTKQVDKNLIKEMENEIIRFLKGDSSLVEKKLEEEMMKESMNMHYEKAKELKEMLDYIRITLTKQKVEINDNKDIDVFGYYVDKGYISVQVFFIRGSKLVERHSKIWPIIDDEEELSKYITYFYQSDVLLPKEVLVPSIVDENILTEVLKVNVLKPSRGVKKNIVDMAISNAKVALEEEFSLIERDEEKTVKANEELMNILNMDKLDRIEIFDNAHLFGSFNVSGMVVFTDGRPNKNEYRKFKITEDKNDDYGTMKEVIYRRYFRVLKDNLVKPDLIIVDGGIGQIHVAQEVLDSLHMNIPLIGLAKDDHHSTRALIKNDVEIPIDKRSNLFHYLERMQDEVHNFTINYHKKLRSKGSLESILDNIDGIGSTRRNELLKKYKSLNKIKETSIEELDKILPHNVSENLIKFLNEYKTS